MSRAAIDCIGRRWPDILCPDLEPSPSWTAPTPERSSILVTTNLPFDEWTEVFGSERLTGALLDRLTHHVHIPEMNGDSYRLKRSRQNAASQVSDDPNDSWARVMVAFSQGPLHGLLAYWPVLYRARIRTL